MSIYNGRPSFYIKDRYINLYRCQYYTPATPTCTVTPEDMIIFGENGGWSIWTEVNGALGVPDIFEREQEPSANMEPGWRIPLDHVNEVIYIVNGTDYGDGDGEERELNILSGPRFAGTTEGYQSGYWYYECETLVTWYYLCVRIFYPGSIVTALAALAILSQVSGMAAPPRPPRRKLT